MKNRIEYIDAMRGLAMFLVVFVHIEIFCFFNFSYLTFLGSLIILIHMPLFFFISGYVAYNTSLPTKVQFKSKFISLILPMLFFGILYTYLISRKNLTLFILDSAKIGYWFTLVLFEMYMIYYLVKLLSAKLISKYKSFWVWILFLISMIAYIGKYPMRVIDSLDYIGGIFSLHYTMNFLQFFVLGILFMHYKGFIEKFINKFCKSLYVIISLITISFIGAYCKYSFLDPMITDIGGFTKIISMLTGTFCSYLAVIAVFLIFNKYSGYISQNKKKVRWLVNLGTKTLDVYLLHYFIIGLIPLYNYNYFLKTNIVYEIVLISFFSVLVIYFSLILSSIIRKNRVLGKFLLGAKS